MSDVQAIQAVLQAGDFTQKAVCDRLDVREIPPCRPRRQSLNLFLWHTRREQPLDILIRLFLLEQPVAREAAERALAPSALADLTDAGLLQIIGDSVRAPVEIFPHDGLWLTADWPCATSPDVEPVMGFAATTRALAQLMIRKSVRTALDLGTGCGALALLAARNAERVVAVDFNPRAVQTARFNARLNQVANVEFLQGDWLAPVRGQSFDRIVCNPPFVIGPPRGHQHTFNDRPSDELCRCLVGEMAALLAAGGHAQMLCNWAQVRGEDASARLQGWLAGSGCDGWVLASRTQGAAEYAHDRAIELAEDSAKSGPLFDEWMTYFEQYRIEAIGFGMFTIRKPSSDRLATWFRCEPMPPLGESPGEAMAQRFLLWDFLRENQADSDLLKCKLRPAEHLRWEQTHTRGQAGWSSARSQLSLTDGLAVVGNAAPEVARFVAGCRSDRTLGEQAREIAAASGQDWKRFAPEMLKVVRRLIELGFLLPAGLPMRERSNAPPAPSQAPACGQR